MSAAPDLRALLGDDRPAAIPEGIAEFLAQRPATPLLGTAPTRHLVQALQVTPEPSPEAAELARLQKKFDAFTLKDKGLMAQLCSEFLRPHQDEMEADPAGALLWEGLNLWFELAIQIGIMHAAGGSLAATRERVSRTYDRLQGVLTHARERAAGRLLQTVNAEVAAALLTLDDEVQATLSGERDQMTGAADQAQADASEARRALDAASAQLTREREAHRAEMARLEQALAAERRATIDRDRETRNRIQTLERDRLAAQALIAHLNRECERLEAELKEHEMPKTDLRPTTALERASLCLHLRARFQDSRITWDEVTVRDPQHRVPNDSVYADWRAAYPTPAAMLEQLRAVVRPILAAA